MTDPTPGPTAAPQPTRPIVDRDRLAEVCAAMVNISSPTGDERPLAAWIASELDLARVQSTLQPLDSHQANTWARLPGIERCGNRTDPGGATLMLYAPIDTLTTGYDDEDLPWAGDRLEPHQRPMANRDGNLISGLGAMNPKGHAACVFEAFTAIAESGLELPIDLVAAFGAGGMPTNARSVGGSNGRRNTGQGAGCSYLVEQGVWADAAVIAKPGWTVSWEEVGLAWIDITVRGLHTYVGARHRLPYRNPISDAATVIAHLERWFPTYSARHTTGLVAPQGIVAAVDAGCWRMAAVTPAQARIRVDLRIAPDQTPLDACREVRASLDELVAADPDLDVTAELALGIAGSRTDPDHWITRRAIAVWERSEGRTHEPVRMTSGATDANILRNRGIPSVRVGMPKVTSDGDELDFAAGMNTVDLAEMERLAQYLVDLAVDVAAQPLADLTAGGPP